MLIPIFKDGTGRRNLSYLIQYCSDGANMEGKIFPVAQQGFPLNKSNHF